MIRRVRTSAACLLAVLLLVGGCRHGGEEGSRSTQGSGAHEYTAPVLVSMSGVGGFADLFLVDVKTGSLRNLTESKEDEFTASWSPDGKRIAFVRQYTDGDQIGGEDLFVLDVQSGRVDPLVVTDTEEGYPAWSPDGTRIAFVGTHEFVLGAIYTIRPDGTDLRLVGARGDGPETLAWSPRGDAIAFTANVGPGDDLRVHVIEAAGGSAVPVSKGEIDRDPVWSPRAEEILFIRGYDLYAVDAESHEERKIGVSGLLASWYDQMGSVVVVDTRELRLVTPEGDSRKIAQTSGLVYAPPAARP